MGRAHRRFDGGWTIEMAIPFKSLRYQPGTDQTWGINLRRVVRWKNEWSYLAQVPRALTTFRGLLKISSAGTLEGLQVPSGSRNLELKPFALAGVSTDNTVTPLLSERRRHGRIGGDVKYGITQNITADLTVNTDFAQVEVDEQQVNLTRFNLFFPEKRDFFLEGLGTFAFAGRASAGLAAGTGDTPYLFFSRRIGLDQSRVIPLRAGGRVTGKAGKFTFGAINVQTGDDDTARTRVGQLHGAARQARHPAPQQHRRHVHASHRDARPHRTNDGFGVDAAMSFYQNVRLRRVPRRHADRGPRGRQPELSRLLRLQRRQVRRPGRAPGRRAELPSGDRLRAPHRHAAQLRPGALQSAADGDAEPPPHHDAGQPQLPHQQPEPPRYARSASGASRPSSPTATCSAWPTPTTSSGWCGRSRSPPASRCRSAATTFHTTRIGYIAGQQRPLSGEVVLRDRHVLQRRPHPISVNTARVQVTPQVSLEPSFSINWVDLVQGSFTAKVARTRATYTITPRMFVSGIVQYNSAGTSFGSNVRFRWEYRPGSELFVVYTDDYDTEALRQTSTSLRNRAFVVKFNRLFRL